MAKFLTTKELRIVVHATPSVLSEIFFEAMNKGYARDTPPMKVSGMLGGFQTVFEKEPWLVIDMWEKNNVSEYTTGQVRIYYNKTIVWAQQYFGVYKPETIDFLKAALFLNYYVKIFHGGRGPSEYTSENFTYQNNVDEGSSFLNFSGREAVFYKKRLAGEHRYHGGVLL